MSVQRTCVLIRFNFTILFLSSVHIRRPIVAAHEKFKFRRAFKLVRRFSRPDAFDRFTVISYILRMPTGVYVRNNLKRTGRTGRTTKVATCVFFYNGAIRRTSKNILHILSTCAYRRARARIVIVHAVDASKFFNIFSLFPPPSPPHTRSLCLLVYTRT